MVLPRLMAAPAGVTQFPMAAPAPEEPEVDPAVAATINDVRVQMRREQFLFDSWFDNCCSEMSFNELRRRVRWDKEASGWGCIELIRDGDGRLMRLGYVPGYTVRPMVNEGEAVEVVEPNPATFLSADREVRIRRRFRRPLLPRRMRIIRPSMPARNIS